MAAPTTITGAIDQNSLGPKRVTIDGETVEQFDLEQLIAAEQYQEAKKATAKGVLGLYRFKIIPGGTQ